MSPKSPSIYSNLKNINKEKDKLFANVKIIQSKVSNQNH
jgi:hypothetical protein